MGSGPRRNRRHILAVSAIFVLVVLPAYAANHLQTGSGRAIVFDHKSGNEWWVELLLGGADASTVSSVQAMDTGGPWVGLTKRFWGAWANSFHIEPGHQVRFRANWADGDQIVSCFFTHPAGVEQCPSPTTTSTTPTTTPTTPTSTSPPPPSGFDATFTGVKGNNWWVEARVTANQPLAGIDARINCAGAWRPLALQSWGAWAASFNIITGSIVDLRARASSGASDLSTGYLWPMATPAAPCSNPLPPLPQPPSPTSKEAEDFAAKTTGGRVTSASASGGAAWNLWSNGHIEQTMRGDGSRNLTIGAFGTPANGVFPTMVVRVDGNIVATFAVGAAPFADYEAPPVAPGDHTVRIQFTNDVKTPTEDRNLILDLVTSADSMDPPPGPSFDLAPGGNRTLPFDWPGGPGYLMPHVATPPTNNTKPTVTVALDGTPLDDAIVEGPVGRPFLTPFTLPSGTHEVTYGAVGGPLNVSDLKFLAARPALHVTGNGSRVHAGGFQEGESWRFVEYGYIEAPLVVETSGWYGIRAQGIGTMDAFGPIVHVWLNRTVIAEGFQTTTVDLSGVRFLHAGLGYTMGASFENPGGYRSVRFDNLSASPTAAPGPLAPAALVPAMPAVDGWPQFGRDGHNTRSNPDPTLPGPGDVADLTLLWRTTLDGSVTGTPAVVGDRVYAGTWGDSVYALNATTGAIVWRTSLPTRVDDSPAVSRGLVIVGAGPFVYALNATTGAVAWSRLLTGHFWASPIVEGDSVFMGVDADRGAVVRLNLTTGAVIWDSPTTPILDGGARVWATVLVPPGSGKVILGTSPGRAWVQPDTMDSLMVMDRATGAILWSHRFFAPDWNDESSPEGLIRQNRDISGTPHLTLLDGRPTILASEKHGPAWAVDLADGRVIHGSRLLEPRATLIGSGGVSDGIEVVSSELPNRVGAFDLRTGDLLWEQDVMGQNWAPVAIGNGVVWIGSWAGKLRAYDLHTGVEVAALDAGGGVTGGAALANGRVYVGALTMPADGTPWSSFGILPGIISAWG